MAPSSRGTPPQSGYLDTPHPRWSDSRSDSSCLPIEQLEEDRVLEAIGRGETIDHFETLRQRQDGTLIPISLTVSPIRDASGRIVGASTIARDLMRTHRAQRDALRLAAIVDSSDDAIVGKDLTSIVTSWNAAAERMFGYSSEEMIGQVSAHVDSRRSST